MDPEFRPQICTFSPNGQYLVTGTTDGFIEFWDPITGKYPESLLHFQKTEEGSTLAMENGISAFAFSEDGEYLASGSSDGSVAVSWPPTCLV